MAPLTREIIDAEHYVARYAKGRLAGSELEAFEEFCLLHPELVPEVATDRAFIRSARTMSAAGELVAPLERGRLRQKQVLRYLAMAASVAMLGIIAWQWFASRPAVMSYSLYAAAGEVPASRARQAPAEAFRLVRTRDSNIPQLELPRGIEVVLLELAPSDTAGASAYRVSLESETGGRRTERATLARVTPDAADPDVVKVFVDVGAVETAHLYLTLHAAGKSPDEYELRVVRHP